MLLPPIDRGVDEYEPEVRMLSGDVAVKARWLEA